MNEPLRLNHLFRVVDAETFAAARDLPWLRDVFAPSELRTTRRPDWEYTGLYWYGTSTYIELFESGTQGPPGSSGIAFGLESAGATAAVTDAWREALGQAEHRLVVRPFGDDVVPWFHIAHASPDHHDGLKLWAMEYHAGFLAAWHPGRTPARGITRADVLERYAVVSPGPASPLLDDVTSVTIACTPSGRTFFERHLGAFAADSCDAGASRVITGDGITFGLVEATPDRHGVQEVVCRLRRPAGRETLTLGRLTISIDDTRMVWRFR